MNINNKARATLIIPVYNGALTLQKTFQSLNKLKHKEIIDKVIIINDASTDDSESKIQAFINKTQYSVDVINHLNSAGLSSSYNEGTLKAETEYVITMHQDIVITNSDAYLNLISPLNHEIVASYPKLSHPKELWETYPFWQKCLFSRHVLRTEEDLTGKFDCFNKEALVNIGLFDNSHYRTAGEDADMKRRIKSHGLKYSLADVNAVHSQEADPSFGIKKYLKKESQLAEARGVVLRIHGTESMSALAYNFFREGLLICLFIPYIQILSLILILSYAYKYTSLIQPSFKSYFINILLIPINTYYSLRGFITKQQSI